MENKLEPKFDIENFLRYLKSQFSVMDSLWAWNLTENLVSFAADVESDIPDGIVVFLSNMIPEVEFDEVAAFTPDAWLSDKGRKRKQNFWKNIDCRN